MELRLKSVVVFAATIGIGALTAGAAVDFRSQVVPILKSKCYECHTGKKRETDKKPKGGLALDTTAGILAGAVIEKGNAEESALYYRTILPADDEELMPPKKSGQPLTKKETEILKAWIEEGARFGKGTGAKPTGPVKRLTAQEVKALGLREPDADAVARLTEMGATITPFSVKTPQLVSVEFISSYNRIGDEQIRELMAIAPNIVDLNLAKTKITDEALKDVGAFARLTKLNLNNTKVSGAGLEHLATLTNLEWLNLYGTPVDDDGLPHIAKFRKLKSIYLWNSKVSKEGMDKLASSLKGTKVVDEVTSKRDRFDLSDF